MKNLLAFLLILISIKISFAQVDLAKLDTYIETARQQWEAPGLAIGIVQNGKVIHAKGYGLRELGKPDKVDTKTLFAICSTTKAMTAAAMGILVDEGKIHWDDKVLQYLPEFQLYDPYVTRELRVRDLFTHNAGLGNADFLWYGSDLNSEEILYRMRFSPPAYPFRGGYTYQNIMYLAAGTIIEKVSGMSWAQFMEVRLFQPIGMSNTFATQKQSLGYKNRSIPHYKIEGKIVPIEDSDDDNIAPAGSVWSCIDDMMKWTQFVLDSAKVNGKRLLKPETYSEWLKPQAIVSDAGFYPTQLLTKPHWKTYALGWFQHDYNGRAISFHTGSLAGTIAILGLIPDEKIGVYVFGNLDHAEVRHALMYKVFDVLAGQAHGRDWSTEMLALYRNLDKSAEEVEKKQAAKRVMNTQPSFPLEHYAGVYSHPLYGEATVLMKAGKLHIQRSSKLWLALEHWHFDTFLGTWNVAWNGKTLISFSLDEDGRIHELKIGNQIFKKK